MRDPSLVGLDVLVLGRQVQTDHGGFIDVLAVDVDGAMHVLELKRERTPRDVIAQALDYGSWVDGLGLAEIEAIYSRHNVGSSLPEDFADRFGQSLPDTLSDAHQMTVIASALDPASDRIIEYLADRHGVPINAVFFRYFADERREYLARTWLIDLRQRSRRPQRQREQRRRRALGTAATSTPCRARRRAAASSAGSLLGATG